MFSFAFTVNSENFARFYVRENKPSQNGESTMPLTDVAHSIVAIFLSSQICLDDVIMTSLQGGNKVVP